MKIRSLLLGSVAAAGLSTGGAFAADLGVLTSLDVCDALGLSGLTISSDTNCLQITGEVKYKFTWGDYRPDAAIDADTTGGSVHYPSGNGLNDWQSRFDAWIKFVATADSDFGPAKAVLKLKEVDHYRVDDEALYAGTGVGSSDTDGVDLDEAYVSIGDSTVIMAGKKGSIIKKGDDEPLNWLGLFNSEAVDLGVGWGPYVAIGDGNHVIQVTTDLGNGVSLSGGIENIKDSVPAESGTAFGVIAYAGEGISAHVSVAAAGILDGDVEDWGVHAGFAGTFDNFKVVLAGAFSNDDILGDYWNVLGSVSATFDMFTLAASAEATSEDEWGVGGSLQAAVTDGVKLNLGGRYYQETAGNGDVYEVAAGVEFAVTESLTLTSSVGYVNDSGNGDMLYGKAKLAWAPGGSTFTSSIAATVNTEDAYKIETEFKKTFE